MTGVRVSCIVAAYNAERYLAKALESLLRQTLPAAELVVIDDGSTDDTAKVASSFGARVRLIQQVNEGPVAARNRGIRETNGELITFLDADDLAADDRFALQVGAFHAEPGLQICAGMVQNFQGDLHFVDKAAPGYGTEIMARRSLYDRIGVFNDGWRHAGALDWMLRVRSEGATERLLHEVVIYRRLHEKNLSRSEASHSLQEHLHVLHARIKRGVGGQRT
jgi:glycosyltransferase involved in cell wall biosynthesis